MDSCHGYVGYVSLWYACAAHVWLVGIQVQDFSLFACLQIAGLGALWFTGFTLAVDTVAFSPFLSFLFGDSNSVHGILADWCCVFHALTAHAFCVNEFVANHAQFGAGLDARLLAVVSKDASLRACVWIIHCVGDEDWMLRAIKVSTCASSFWYAVSGSITNQSMIASTAWACCCWWHVSNSLASLQHFTCQAWSALSHSDFTSHRAFWQNRWSHRCNMSSCWVDC